MIAADSAGDARAHGNDHELWIGGLKRCDDDRDQNAEGAPACACGERQETADEENDHRQEIHHGASGAFDQASDVSGGAEAVGHRFQRPGKGQDQDRRDHRNESLGHAFHEFDKAHNAAREIKDQRQDEAEKRADSQPDGRIAGGKRFHKANAVEKSATPDHADDAAENERGHGH